MISCLSIMIGALLFYKLWDAELISNFAMPAKKMPFNNLEEFIFKTNKKVKKLLSKYLQYLLKKTAYYVNFTIDGICPFSYF